MPLQPDALLFFLRDLDLGGVLLAVQARPAPQPRLRGRRPDEPQDRLVAHQGLACPVAADLAEHPVFDQVPLRRRRREVPHRDRQPELVRQPLQPRPPAPAAAAIAPAAVRLDHQAAGARVMAQAFVQQPAADGRGREPGRLPRRADYDVPGVAADVVDAVGDGPAIRQAGEVVVEDVPRRPPPAPAGVLEVADQFLLLAVHAEDRPAAAQELAPPPRQQPELAVPVGVLGAGQALAVGPQGVALLPQQPADGGAARGEAAPGQLVGQLLGRLVRPAPPADGVPGGGILEQLVQGGQDAGRFFSRRGRPPPGRRARPGSSGMPPASARWPRRMVVRLRPVTWATSVTPPCPYSEASRPAKRRRLRSSNPARTALMAAWYSANSGSIPPWHPRQQQGRAKGRWSAMTTCPPLSEKHGQA